MRRIPEGWNDYISLNDVVEGTRFLPFKTPLVGSRFSPDVLMNRVDNLGFVLNLVKTTRYYKPEVLGKKQIQTMHFPLTGHGELPEEHHIKSIFDILLTYMSGAEDPKKLIGVHCTHGINRTGYIICRFMIDMLGVPPDKAIERFVRARGHRFVRPAYEEDLMRRSPSINTEAKKWHEIGGQVISAAVLNVTVDADMSEIQRHVNNNRQRDYTSRSRNQHQESTGSRHQDHEGTRSRNPDHERTRSRNPDHERTRSRDQERERSPANDADRLGRFLETRRVRRAKRNQIRKARAREQRNEHDRTPPARDSVSTDLVVTQRLDKADQTDTYSVHSHGRSGKRRRHRHHHHHQQQQQQQQHQHHHQHHHHHHHHHHPRPERTKTPDGLDVQIF